MNIDSRTESPELSQNDRLLHSHADAIMTNDGPDSFLTPAFSLRNRLLRAAWGVVYVLLFRPSPRPCHRWRVFLLRCFGAKLGSTCFIYGRARIWAPWNLTCGDQATIGDEAIIYNPEPITLGIRAIVSQQAYLCGATHDYEDPAFPLIAFPISVGPYAWICARATVQPGISVGEGAILALGSVATRDLDPWTIYAGVPARRVKPRVWRPTKPRVTRRQDHSQIAKAGHES
jgi:putative colanic acid biosynthesis acetyltransferase WcaF